MKSSETPKKGVAGFVDRFPLDEVSPDLEPSLSFDTNWLQDHRNHRALLDCFWRHVKAPTVRWCFFYAKQVPFVEGHRPGACSSASGA